MISCATLAGRGHLEKGHKTALIAGLLLWLLAAPALPISGAAARHFRDGIEAADGGDWRRVVTEMGRAIALEPSPGGRVKIYGMRFEAYVPHYWLGMAQEELGDCSAAIESFDMVLGSSELEDLLTSDQREGLEERAAGCRERLAAIETRAPDHNPALETSLPAGANPSQSSREPAPPFLRRAAANYLAGDYESVTAALETLETLTSDRHAIGTGLLLRGAARFALHRRAVPSDPDLLELAKSDLADFRRLEPARRPSDFWFSPDLLELYDQASTRNGRPSID